MSVDLNCGACGAQMGYTDTKDMCEKKYFYKSNEDGEPVCPNCGSDTFKWWYPLAWVGLLTAIAVVINLVLYLVMYLGNEFDRYMHFR